MPSASRHRLARRLAVTAVAAASLGAGGAGIAAAATSTSSAAPGHHCTHPGSRAQGAAAGSSRSS
jgi:hypothetical protein